MTHHSDHCDQPALDAIYKAELNERIGSLLADSCVSTQEFLVGTEGAYMLDIVEVLRYHQGNEDAIVGLNADRLLQELLSSPSGFEAANNGIVNSVPDPHPLDFDWRFVEPSFRYLEAEICSHSHSSIGIFGAPTLFLFLTDRGYDAALYDKNERLVQSLKGRGHLKVFVTDLFDAVEIHERYDVVVADPPWYRPDYLAFTRTAQSVIPVGGILLLSVLPRLTRPGASADRQQILSDAFLAGLDLVQVNRAALLYDSPPFEKKALAVENIHSGPWRRGDLFIFRRALRDSQLRAPDRTPDETSWNSYLIGRTVVRVKNSATNEGEFSIRAASESGDLHFHSVSRRSPTRGRIDLWTSQDLALTLTRSDCASELLKRLEKNGAADRALEEVSLKFNLSEASQGDMRRLVNLLSTDSELEENGK